jgi:competence protein ComEC
LTVFNPTQPRTFSNQNENSVVLKLQAGQTSFLLEGDAGFDAEDTMINAGLNLRSNVLKVGHHGSATATGNSFLNNVAPSYAVISCALVNTYGHPAASTLQRLADHNVTTYGTYTYGSIIATTDGNTISFTNTNAQSPLPTSTPVVQPATTPTPSMVAASPVLTATPLPLFTVSPATSTNNPSPTASIPESPTPETIVVIATALVAVSAGMIWVKKKSNGRLKGI